MNSLKAQSIKNFEAGYENLKKTGLQRKLHSLYEDSKAGFSLENSEYLENMKNIAGNRGFSYNKRINKITNLVNFLDDSLTSSEKTYVNNLLETTYSQLTERKTKADGYVGLKRQIKNRVGVAKNIMSLKKGLEDNDYSKLPKLEQAVLEQSVSEAESLPEELFVGSITEPINSQEIYNEDTNIIKLNEYQKPSKWQRVAGKVKKGLLYILVGAAVFVGSHALNTKISYNKGKSTAKTKVASLQKDANSLEGYVSELEQTNMDHKRIINNIASDNDIVDTKLLKPDIHKNEPEFGLKSYKENTVADVNDYIAVADVNSVVPVVADVNDYIAVADVNDYIAVADVNESNLIALVKPDFQEEKQIPKELQGFVNQWLEEPMFNVNYGVNDQINDTNEAEVQKIKRLVDDEKYKFNDYGKYLGAKGAEQWKDGKPIESLLTGASSWGTLGNEIAGRATELGVGIVGGVSRTIEKARLFEKALSVIGIKKPYEYAKKKDNPNENTFEKGYKDAEEINDFVWRNWWFGPNWNADHANVLSFAGGGFMNKPIFDFGDTKQDPYVIEDRLPGHLLVAGSDVVLGYTIDAIASGGGGGSNGGGNGGGNGGNGGGGFTRTGGVVRGVGRGGGGIK